VPKILELAKNKELDLTAGSGLSKEDVERMKREADLHAEEDRRKKEEVELRNEADSLVYRSEKLLQDFAGKVPANDKEKIETAIKDVKDALNAKDFTRLRPACDKLNQAWHEVSANIYRTTGESKAQAGTTEAGAKSAENNSNKTTDGTGY
jgi:molecular chaperone DnaK